MSESADELVERVLAGLGGTQPAAGMELRVAAGVEQRMRERQGSSASWRRGWMSAAGVCAAAVVACVVWLPGARRPVVRNPGLTAAAHAVALTVPDAAVPRMEWKRRVMLAPRPLAAEPVSLAVEETMAPSMPAPALPLTRQEKLLLRIAKDQDPVQMAELDPAMRAAELADAKEKFRQFFDGKSRTEVKGEQQ